MASRWFNLILGVILLQSVLAFGPIDVTDAEWIEYMNLLSDPNYRLPTTTKPINYKVKLDTNLQNFEYLGDVEIKIKVGAVAVNEIQLHCRGLTITPSSVSVTLDTTTQPVTNLVQPSQSFTCEANTDFLKISTSNLNPNTDYIVKMSFTGTLQTDMRGFYRSWYIDNTGDRRWMATTQFQPGHARRAFPCYDEPSFKATFDITLVRNAENTQPSLSNMPINSDLTSNNDGKITETFYTTPIMSTYLLAFIVSNYIPVETGTNSERPFRIFARNNIGDTGKYSLEIGEKLLTLMETYTAYPYYTMADNMEMKQAAIPDFSAGAMENWGLLTYREALILYDPANSNNWYKQRIANIISHEIAHMWFGNLVTCDWWDTLWLNEGFARFYQYYLTHKAEPEMGYDTRFIVEQLQVAMLSDSSASAHALTNPDVSDPDSVRDHFSTITYAKGASILRMTQHLLGEDIYQKGLQAYLKDRALKTAIPEDLFRNLEAEAGNALDAYDGMTIARYFKSWSDKAGHPLLTVNVDHASGRMTVVQTQFDVNNGVSSSNGLWDIPLTWTRAKSPDFNNLKPSEFMSGPLKIIDRGSTGREWVIFNKQQSGFYRVNYDPSTWALITLALRSDNREVIHEYNRAQIVDDVFVLARSSILSYTRALNILSFLEFEDKYAPWVAAIAGFNFALRRLAHDDIERENLKNIIFKSSTAIVQRLGFNEGANSHFMDDLLRMHVMTFLCNAGHEQCSEAATQSFQAWRVNGTRIPPNMRPWVYCGGLRNGNEADFDYFWQRYLAEDLSNEKVVMINAAGCTGNENALHKLLNTIVDTSVTQDIRPQDYSAAISSAVSSNEYNTMRVFNWLKNNPQHLDNENGRSLLQSATNRLLNEAQIVEVETWFTSATPPPAAAITVARNGIATSRANMQWYRRRLPEFAEYFRTGYFEEGFELPVPEPSSPPTTIPEPTSTEEPISDPTTDPPTTPEPDSANIVSLSFFTLIVTLIINMV
ncbi:unnamed protein product [Spodoptera littoralis]|uniref:Aminopeptidase n=1 Tax=Spodoptera littoralis TaxID=7109 RepID=A0A9P0ILP3_SPOLI|nr:unnamed protein product [Spodoptera littoralis]CAH1647273.1 unnamed protein product [Spodoptera littoralis]